MLDLFEQPLSGAALEEVIEANQHRFTPRKDDHSFSVIEAITGESVNWGQHNLELYLHQQKLLEAILDSLKTHKTLCVSAATGSGKTIVGVALAQHLAAQGRKVWWLSPQITVQDQSFAAMAKYATDPEDIGFLQGEFSHNVRKAKIVCATPQTLTNRVKRDPYLVGKDDCILVDEAHLGFEIVRDLLHGTKRIGVGFSATPEGASMGLTYEELVVVPEAALPLLVENGRLAPLRYFCPVSANLDALKFSTSTGDFTDDSAEESMKGLACDVVNAYKSHAEGPAILFAASVKHAEELAEHFNADGITAEVVTGHTSQADRPAIYERLRSGQTKVVSSCLALTTGFDLPECQTAIYCRPSNSIATLVQCAGRVMRVCEGKEYGIFLDCSSTLERLGLPHLYVPTGLKTAPLKKPTLDPRKEQRIITCDSCDATMAPGQLECPACGHQRKQYGKVIQKDDGYLVELTPEGMLEYEAAQAAAANAERQKQIDAVDFLGGLQYWSLKQGYKPGNALYMFKDRYKRWPSYAEKQAAQCIENAEASRYADGKRLQRIIASKARAKKKAKA
ncbi:DEAD/DEAH box helicase [Luminiphilus sp.]|nr:DEAD/DEAH box helicase [Luminiphilus sp.]